MLNLPKDQSPTLSHGKRRAPEPQASGDANDIDSRPAKRPYLEPPVQGKPGEPRITSTKPLVRVPDTAPHSPWSIAPPASWTIAPPVVQPALSGTLPVWRQPSHDVAHALPIARHVGAETITLHAQVISPTSALPGIASQPYRDRLAAQAFEQVGSMGIITSTTTTTTTTAAPTPAVTHTAPQLRAVYDALWSTGLVAEGENVESVNDGQFERIARQVYDAKPVVLEDAICTIYVTGLHSLQDVTDWLQLCVVLCLHYDDQQEKELLWQCLERILMRIVTIRQKQFRDLHDMAKTTLLATITPAGFIRILQRAKASKWQGYRLSTLIDRACIANAVTLAITRISLGLHPEKTAQQAAADLLLARYAARTAHAAPATLAGPAVAPEPREEVDWLETVNPEFLFMPFFGEDMIDPGPLPEFWWLADSDNLAAHAFEPASESTSTATTTTATTPTPAVTRTALQLQAAPDAHWHDELIADDDNERPGTESLLDG